MPITQQPRCADLLPAHIELTEDADGWHLVDHDIVAGWPWSSADPYPTAQDAVAAYQADAVQWERP